MPATNLPGWNIGSAKSYKTMVIKPHVIITGRPTHTWDIKINIIESACEGGD
jgi:hypothetical protein